MKQKIKVEIHKLGNSNYKVLEAVGKFNGGELELNRDVLEGYILGQRVEYPNLFKSLKLTNDGDTLHISEDNGETVTLSLTWTEVHELQPETNPDTLTSKTIEP